MRILIAGSNGLIGSAVTSYLASQGHEVVRLVRRVPGSGEVRWDPDAGTVDAEGLEGFDGVVHVASIPQAKWTKAFLQRMRENRIRTSQILAEALASRQHKPRVFVCASGMGIYAPSAEDILTEDSPTGTNFLATLQVDGEAATAPATAAGIRVVHLRIPTVLGGPNLVMFTRQLPSRMGSGRQWWSWVARDEMASIVHHALVTEHVTGPVNAVSPNPVRNSDFFTAIGRVIGRTPRLPIPAFMARLILGEIADALLLSSRRIIPRKLLDTGYRFRFPELETALRHELGVIAEGDQTQHQPAALNKGNL